MDRKTFLKYSSLVGVAAVAGSVKPISDCMRFNPKLYKVTDSRNLMGTFVNLTVLHESAIMAEEAIGQAFQEMAKVCRLLTRFESDSAIGVLNRDGFLQDFPPEVYTVVSKSGQVHYLSGGVFDITVAPLLKLYQECFEATAGPPDRKRILESLKLVDGQAVVLNRQSIRFNREGMNITLDGIAKGFVVDCGAGVLETLHIEHGLINAGGDLRAIGGKNHRNPWRVAIQDPAQRNGVIDLVDLNEGAIATSGNYEIYFDQDKLYHHIIRPDTGLSPSEVSSVTVRSDSTMDADALSTTVFAMGPKKGLRFIEQLDGSECLIIGSDKQPQASSGWTSALHAPRNTAIEFPLSG